MLTFAKRMPLLLSGIIRRRKKGVPLRNRAASVLSSIEGKRGNLQTKRVLTSKEGEGGCGGRKKSNLPAF